MIRSLLLFTLPLLTGPLLTEPARPEPAPAPAMLVAEGPAEALFGHARELRYRQRWFEAAQTYRELIQKYPTSSRLADARYWLASCLEQDQRWDAAAEAYSTFLSDHPDQRMLGKEARLNRVRCWGIRQWDSPAAQAGLARELTGEMEELRIAAALQLARRKDTRAIPVLQAGLQQGRFSEACRLALVNMGIQPRAVGPAQGRFLVVRIKEQGKSEAITVRLALGLARAVGGYLSDDQVRQARQKGVNLEAIMEQALGAPKGTELFSLDDGKSTVTVTVE